MANKFHKVNRNNDPDGLNYGVLWVQEDGTTGPTDWFETEAERDAAAEGEVPTPTDVVEETPVTPGVAEEPVAETPVEEPAPKKGKADESAS